MQPQTQLFELVQAISRGIMRRYEIKWQKMDQEAYHTDMDHMVETRNLSA